MNKELTEEEKKEIDHLIECQRKTRLPNLNKNNEQEKIRKSS